MKIEISDAKKIELERNIKNMLFGNGRVHVLRSIKIESKVTKGLFSRQDITTHYITDAEVHMWHSQSKFVGILSERSTKEFLQEANLYAMRKNWLMMKEQIEGFGFKITPFPDEKHKLIIDDSGSMKPTIPNVEPVPTPCPLCGNNHPEYHLCNYSKES